MRDYYSTGNELQTSNVTPPLNSGFTSQNKSNTASPEKFDVLCVTLSESQVSGFLHEKRMRNQEKRT